MTKPAFKAVLSGKLSRFSFNKVILGGLAVAVCSALILLFRLTSLTQGQANQTELNTKQLLLVDSRWWKSLSFLNGPYYLLLHGTYAISRNLFSFRLASAICGFIAAMLLYWLASQWYGYKLALLSSAALITSFGFLTVSRQASPLAFQLIVLISLLIGIYALDNWDSVYSLLALTLISCLVLYVPGAIWLVLVALIMVRREIKETFLNLSRQKQLGLVLLETLLLVPLAYRLIVHYSSTQLLNWLGYGLHGKLTALKDFGINFYHTPLNLFIHASSLPSPLSVGHMPLIPIAETVIILIGLYCYGSRLNSLKWRSVLVLSGAAWILTGLGIISVYVLLPTLALLIGSGLAYMLKLWFGVFPRNPIAKYGGLLIMAIVVVFCCFFAARSYFVAWSNQPSVVNDYSHRLT